MAKLHRNKTRRCRLALGDFNGDGMLDIVTANYSSSNLSVLLQATAVLSRTEIVFPKTNVGSSMSEKVTLSNVGSSPFNIYKFSLNGARSANFSETHTCGKTLAAGASCMITITFTPQYADKFVNIKLEISDSAANVHQTVYLSGTSLAN